MKEIMKKVRLIKHLVSISTPLSGAHVDHLFISFPLSFIFLLLCHSVDHSLNEELSSLYDHVWVQGMNPFVKNTYCMPPLVVPHEILDQDIVSREPDDDGGIAIPDNESVQFLSIKLSGDSSEPLLPFWQSHILV